MLDKIQHLVDSINTHSTANFVDRLKRYPNIDKIYYSPTEFSTHKLSYVSADDKGVVFPMIQEIDEKLVEFTDWKDALNSAKEHNDYITVPLKLAEKFTKTYKEYYPGFSEESRSYKKGGFIDYIKYFEPGGSVSMMPDITISQSSIQTSQLPNEKDLYYKSNINTAKEQERLQQLRQQQQGTLSQGSFEGDGMTPEQRNQIMYNPKGVGDVVKGSNMRSEIEYNNGNSVWNGLETVGKTALAAGAGSAVLGAAGQSGQVISNANKVIKTADALSNIADGYQSGDNAKMTSGALSMVSKAPVGKLLKNSARIANSTLKVINEK